MKNVEYQTKQLIREIRKSNEYNQFRRLSAKISSQPELKKQVDAYRKKRFALQNAAEDTGELLQMEKDYPCIVFPGSEYEPESGLCLSVNEQSTYSVEITAMLSQIG